MKMHVDVWEAGDNDPIISGYLECQEAWELTEMALYEGYTVTMVNGDAEDLSAPFVDLNISMGIHQCERMFMATVWTKPDALGFYPMAV